MQKASLRQTQISDTALLHVKQLKELESLFLDDTKVTDAGLANLHEQKKLKGLSLDNTRVTSEGVERLRQALPKVQVRGTPLGPPLLQ